jgi:hypothetical protein
MQADQRSPDNQAGGVHTLSAKNRWQLTERQGSKNSAKKYQGAEPDTERKVNQRMKEGSHKCRIDPGPETTRGSITGQVKALSMIVAMEGLIPDRRAGSLGGKNRPSALRIAPAPPATISPMLREPL